MCCSTLPVLNNLTPQLADDPHVHPFFPTFVGRGGPFRTPAGRLSSVAPAGTRGYGRSLSGRAGAAEAAGGRQGAAAGTGRRSHVFAALRDRGPGRGLADPRQHRADLRGGLRGWAALHRPGVRGGPKPGRLRGPPRPARFAPRPVDHAAGGLGVGQGRPRGRGAPRHQAGEHHAGPRRRGESGRLRPGPGHARRGGQRSDADRHYAGHAALHEPGTGRRQAPQPAERHLLVRRDLLPHAFRRRRPLSARRPWAWRCST